MAESQNGQASTKSPSHLFKDVLNLLVTIGCLLAVRFVAAWLPMLEDKIVPGTFGLRWRILAVAIVDVTLLIPLLRGGLRVAKLTEKSFARFAGIQQPLSLSLMAVGALLGYFAFQGLLLQIAPQLKDVYDWAFIVAILLPTLGALALVQKDPSIVVRAVTGPGWDPPLGDSHTSPEGSPSPHAKSGGTTTKVSLFVLATLLVLASAVLYSLVDLRATEDSPPGTIKRVGWDASCKQGSKCLYFVIFETEGCPERFASRRPKAR